MVSTDILKRSTINTVRYSIDKIYTKFIELQGNQHFQFSLPITAKLGFNEVTGTDEITSLYP